jgi:hypothetical protein
MQLVSGGNVDDYKKIYYLPHHLVFKHDSSTTKLRVALEASSESTNGHSLNDNIVDWTYCSTTSVLNIANIPQLKNCLHGRHLEDVLANLGSSQGHRTATNTVESFTGYLDSDSTL